MTMRTILVVLTSVLIACNASCASAQQPDSTALFFVLGMLNDYIGRDTYQGNSLVEMLYPDENVVGEIFKHYLNELKNDMHYTGTIRIKIGDVGHIAFYSKEIAAAIDSCFVFDFSDSSTRAEVEGRWIALYVSRNLKRELFPVVWNNEAYAFAFLRGVYLRNAPEDILAQLGIRKLTAEEQGRDPLQRAHLSFSNSSYKESLTQFLLYHYGCQDIAVIDRSRYGAAPHVIDIFFEPSPAILSDVILREVGEYSRYKRKLDDSH